MSESVAQVEFHGQKLLTTEKDGVVYVAMKPVVENIGLTWRKQLALITRDPVLSEGITIMGIPSAGGVQDAVFLPLEYLNGWLFRVNASRYAGNRRESIIAYQRECYRALYSYWHRGGAINPRAHQEQLDALAAELELVKAQTKLLRAADNIFGNRTQFGEISATTGNPKVIPVRGHLKSSRKAANLIANQLIQLCLNLRES
jgi:hypothetical protein